ncbi:Mannose-binding lectin [Macleaya cordata]|uniref:Mannose-binding lectin n=1 Tax=Macleaya cordata TaxID=56857 RepID=A0A200Q6S4_MACCD|nr:Mannose-binding lectin [Macleaya cordata]
MIKQNNSSNDQVGGYEKTKNNPPPICVGPWGSHKEGDPWDDGVHTTIRQLVVVHGAGIDSIKIEYDNKGTSSSSSSSSTSSVWWSQKHGGSGGIKTDKIKLDFPDEFLNSISGHYGSINDWGPVFIRSLTFESNRKTYGPFGTQQGTHHFSFPMTGCKIVGFHGRSSWYLNAIGVYLKPLNNQKPIISPSKMSSQSLLVANYGTDQNGYSVVQGSIGKDYDIVLALGTYTRKGSSNFEGIVSYGPWGGSGGTTFDDEVYTGVPQVNLTRSAAIVSIKVLYDRNGQPIWENKNGGTGGIKSEKIIFDYPFEALTHITGYYGPLMFMGPTVVKSITFHTTERKYGPFGDEQGTFFSSYIQEGMVIGFHGRGGWFLDSIGDHVLKGKLSKTRRSLNMYFNANNSVNNEIDNRLSSIYNVLQVIVKEPVPCGPGPWGGDGGKQWDDGVYTGIKQIYLTKGEAIFSIQIEYDREGWSAWSVRHGGSGGGTATKGEVWSLRGGVRNDFQFDNDRRSKSDQVWPPIRIYNISSLTIELKYTIF